MGRAALIDLAGTWVAHPLPGRALRSENVEFDADLNAARNLAALVTEVVAGSDPDT